MRCSCSPGSHGGRPQHNNVDVIFVVTNPHRIAAICAELESALWDHAGIRINLDKTQLFNRGGFLPPGCQHILQAGKEMTPPVIVWRGDTFPNHQQGIVVLGTPVGHEEFVKSQLWCKLQEHNPKPCQTCNARDWYSCSVRL